LSYPWVLFCLYVQYAGVVMTRAEDLPCIGCAKKPRRWPNRLPHNRLGRPAWTHHHRHPGLVSPIWANHAPVRPRMCTPRKEGAVRSGVATPSSRRCHELAAPERSQMIDNTISADCADATDGGPPIRVIRGQRIRLGSSISSQPEPGIYRKRACARCRGRIARKRASYVIRREVGAISRSREILAPPAIRSPSTCIGGNAG
jgi:hypothetical protein